MAAVFSIDIDVDDTWISPVYDHVHHGKLLSMFEQSREALVADIGFPNDAMLRDGKVLVITNVSVAYKREVQRGRFQVTCDSVVVDGRTIVISQRIVNSKGKTAVQGEISLMFMDGAKRRGMLPPTDFIAAIVERFAPSPT